MEGARFPQPAALRGLRVLVVDDEALVAMLLEDWLLDAGACVVGPARSVEDALAVIAGAEGGGLDAAVLDARLRDCDAAPVADRLAGLAVPFVFTTGWDGAAARAAHAAAPVLLKPFYPDALVAAVARLSGRAPGRAG